MAAEIKSQSTAWQTVYWLGYTWFFAMFWGVFAVGLVTSVKLLANLRV